MARFTTEGLDEIIDQMVQMELTTGELVDEMLFAGAEEVKEAWKESAVKHKHKDTGDMIRSINYPKKVKYMSDIKYLDIYPQGKDRKGIRNAEKAFLLHYGTSKIKGSRWVDYADKIAGPRAENRLRQIFDNWLARIGVSR